MKYKVYYIDDQTNAVDVVARGSELAARRFLALHPRTDASQITVESVPFLSTSRSISHYRASDLLGAPAGPEEVGEEDLGFRFEQATGPDCERVVVLSGSAATLRILGEGLLRNLRMHEDSSDAAKAERLYVVPLFPTDGSPRLHFLQFDVAPVTTTMRVRRPLFLIIAIIVGILILTLAWIGLRSILM